MAGFLSVNPKTFPERHGDSARHESSSPPVLTLEFTTPLRIDLITSDVDSIQIQFTADPGFSYSVEFKETLESKEWFTLTDFLPQSETTTLVAADSTDPPQRFYRLVRNPVGPRCL